MPSRRHSLLLAAALCFVVAGGTAFASNMGFALSYSLPSLPSPGITWLSLPWFYAPTTAEALCQDLGGSAKIASVRRWDETTSQTVSYTCGSGIGSFSLSQALAYGVQPQSWQTVSAVIVGSHDDAYAYSIAPTTGANLTFVSIPYHQAIPDVAGQPGVVDAEDLCQSVGPSLAAVVRHDSTVGGYAAYACGSVFDTPFALELGVGYGLVNAEGQTIAWQPPHY